MGKKKLIRVKINYLKFQEGDSGLLITKLVQNLRDGGLPITVDGGLPIK